MIVRLGGIRSPRFKIAVVTRWWSVGERSPVNSETIALVIGHGRPMRKRVPPRTFVSKIFCPLSRAHFSASFLPLPHTYPFALPPPSARRDVPLLFSLVLKTYLKKIEIQARTSIPTPYFLVIIFIFASSLKQSSLAWSISQNETTPNYEIWVHELCSDNQLGLSYWGLRNAKFT